MISYKNFSPVWLQAILLAWLLAFLLPAQAATEAATVLFSHGNVVLTNNAGSYPLEKGAAVSAGDTVITGEDGRVQMRFSDGGLVSLMPNSRFAVEEYSQPTASNEGSVSVNLLKGGMRALSGSIGKKDQDSYKLKTDVATLGIRGTQFVVVMDGATMRVHVGQGSVALFNDFGELLVPTGRHAEVLPGQAPVISMTPPVFVSAAKPSTQSSEEQQREANQSPAVSSTATEVVRTFEPALAQGAKAGTIILKGEDGNESVEETPSGGEANHSETPPTNGSGTVPINPPIDGYVAIPADKGFAAAYVYRGRGLDYMDSTERPADLQMSVAFGPSSLETVMANNPNESSESLLLAPKALSHPNKVDGLYWNETEDIIYDSVQDEHILYVASVWGAAASDLPPTGQLKYSLNNNGASPVRVSWGEETLTQFDMTLQLHTGNTADVDVEMAITNAPSFKGTATGVSLITGLNTPGAEDFDIGKFKFTADPFSGSGCDNNCLLHVDGFLSGQGGTQAGVVYTFETADGDLSGSAVLDQTSYTPHLP